MSNVLIGIIGVILFIGLALAGALFLGPRFQESVNNSKASATVQAAAQIASGANMANVDLGTPQVSSATALADTHPLVTGGYLKTVPTNPITGAVDAKLIESNGNAAGGTATYVIMPVNPGSGTGEAICSAIARQSGQAAGDAAAAGGLAAIPTRPSGCFRASAAIGTQIASGAYVAFARI